MSIRDKIQKKAQSKLQPGEQVQTAFAGQTHSQWLMLAGIIPFMLLNQYRCVVITDRRIVVFASGKLSQANPSEIVAELPRATRLGPANGLWHKIDLPDRPLLVHKRYHKDLEQADALLSA